MFERINTLADEIGIRREIAWLVIGIVLLPLLKGILRAFGVTATATVQGDLNQSRASRMQDHVASIATSNTTFQRLSNTSEIRLNLQGREFVIQGEACQNIRQALQRGDKIQAIKILREATDTSLVDAKQLVEILEKAIP